MKNMIGGSGSLETESLGTMNDHVYQPTQSPQRKNGYFKLSRNQKSPFQRHLKMKLEQNPLVYNARSLKDSD